MNNNINIQQLLTMLIPNGNSATNIPIVHQPDARFSCKKCEFYTNKICNYNEHLNTKKHKNTSVIFQPVEELPLSIQDPGQPPVTETTSSRKTYPCKKCNKPYLSKKGVWQHSKKCNISTIPTNECLTYKQEIELFTAAITELRKTIAEFIKISQLQSQMIQMFTVMIEASIKK